jgi:hypothetical protein
MTITEFLRAGAALPGGSALVATNHRPTVSQYAGRFSADLLRMSIAIRDQMTPALRQMGRAFAEMAAAHERAWRR